MQAPPAGAASVRRRGPSIGLLLPQEEGPGDPVPRWSLIRQAARTAEAMGIDSVWVVDHLFWGQDPWGRPTPSRAGAQGSPGRPEDDADHGYGVREAWTTLAAVAAATDRVRIGTLVTCTRYRNPVLLANMAETVDEISGGRLILGLGAGDYGPEHERMGIDRDRPIAHFEEALAIVVPLLRTGAVDFEGRSYRAHAELRPRTIGRPGPPVLIGSLGHGPRVLRAVARYADIWNGWIPDRSHASVVPPLREAVDEACRAEGRDPATLARSVAIAVAFGGPMRRREGMISGSVEEVAEAIRAFSDEGIDEVQIRLFPTSRRAIERLARVVEAVHG